MEGMNRPNWIDWLVYRFFRWWWNPIFEKNQKMADAFHTMFGLNLTRKKEGKPMKGVPTPRWWY